MGIYRGYESATGPSGGPTPGGLALMAWYLGRYHDRRSPRPANLGIYNPKRLGNGWSIHAEGRAADLGTAPYSKPPWGWELAEAFRLNSDELGIQCVIFDRKIWSGAYPDAGWRDYHGSNPHTGHLHTELSRDAAQSLTEQRIHEVLGTGGGGGSKPPSEQDWREGIINDMDTINLRGVTSNSKTWVRGANVKRLQGLLLADGHGPQGLVARDGRPDGIGGPATRKFLGQFQRRHDTGYPSNPNTPDYVVGKNTWRALTGVR